MIPIDLDKAEAEKYVDEWYDGFFCNMLQQDSEGMYCLYKKLYVGVQEECPFCTRNCFRRGDSFFCTCEKPGGELLECEHFHPCSALRQQLREIGDGETIETFEAPGPTKPGSPKTETGYEAKKQRVDVPDPPDERFKYLDI